MWFLNLLSYPRGLFVTIFGAVWSLIFSIVVLLLGFLSGDPRLIDFAVNTCWSYPLIRLSGSRVELRGADLVRGSKKGFLILFNHSSHMDIPVLYAYFPRSFRFGAKIELFKIPFFGRAMRACGVLPIDRRNRNKVMQVYQEAITRVNQGECFALAPEGTRQNEPKLGPFKRGPFEFAINAEMDIVPVVLAGTYAVLPRNTIWVNLGVYSRKVILQITPPISTKGYTLDTAEALQERVRAQMLPVHDALNREINSVS